MGKPAFSIIIPCYNERDNLDSLIKKILPLVRKYNAEGSDRKVEIIFVENGSLDDSRAYFQKYIDGKYPDINVIYIDVNQGYGYGIKSGIRAAKGNWVGWIHADMQVGVEDLEKFIHVPSPEPADNPMFDIFLKAERKNRKMVERFFTAGQAWFSSILFREKLRDVASVPMFFKSDFLMKYISFMPEDFTIDVFLYVQAAKCKLKPYWIPVTVKDRSAGISSWNKGFSSRVRQSIKVVRNSFQIRRILKLTEKIQKEE